MNWFVKSLNRKFSVATIAGFLLSSLVFLGLFWSFYRTELEQERAEAMGEVNFLLQTSLENAMLKRDFNGLMYIVDRLGSQPNISSVLITSPSGEVRFSSHNEYKDQILDEKSTQVSSPQTYFMKNVQGQEILRSINPVSNKQPCQQCHGSIETNPVNGILIVDYDASNIRQKARDTTLMLMGAGALIVIINLIGGWWFIRRFILKPVESLGSASHSLAQGQLQTRVYLDGDDELAGLGNAFNSMADNLQSSMREREDGRAFLQSTVDAIPDGLRIIDDDFNLLLVNSSYREQTGMDEDSLIGMKCYQSAHGRDEPCPAELVTCPLQEICKEAKPLKIIHHHKRCDGETLDVEIYAAPLTIIKDGKEQTLLVESIRDLTRQVNFTHEQNLSELGRLASGVAHEIHNPLSSMRLAISSLSGLVKGQDQADDISKYLNVMGQEIDQCIRTTDRLLNLSAAPLEQPELVDVHRAVRDILGLVKWDAEQASIKIIESFPEQPLRIFGSEGELRMAILNLVQNAFHAMPSGGELLITGSLQNDDVVIRFDDNGIGIQKELLPRIFMPFFSRRGDDVHGTGLGLPIARAIIQRFRGSLEVESELGKGSSFTAKIPEARKERLFS